MRFIIILILLYCIPINGQVMLQGNNIISEEGSYFISLPKIRICDNDVQEIVKAYIPIIKSKCEMHVNKDIICMDILILEDNRKYVNMYPISLDYGIPQWVSRPVEGIGYFIANKVIVVLLKDETMSYKYTNLKKRRNYQISTIFPFEDGDSPIWMFYVNDSTIEVEEHLTDTPWVFKDGCRQ